MNNSESRASKYNTFTCNLCDYSGQCQFRLNMHILEIHMNVKNWKYDHCAYAAGQKGVLERHVMKKLRTTICATMPAG
jgi:hypothetical protein